jgi:thiamine pyrophosphate-dependent acetolactate synthase large subunit-like protein
MARPKRMQTQGHPEPVLDRREAVPALIERPQDFLVIAGLAGAAQELTAITQDSPLNFPLGGAMGAAVTMALGLALAQPKRRVLCVTGDGELLMNLGSLATVAAMNPPNLTIICVDNCRYGETGNQETHTGMGVRLDAIAEGSGIPVVFTVNTAADLPEGRRLVSEGGGLSFILLRVKEGPALRNRRRFEPARVRDRFRAALLGVD